MEQDFEIPVIYKHTEHLFAAVLSSTGFSYKIYVDVFGRRIAFEPDEERNFRAIVDYNDLRDLDNIDKSLLEEIANSLISMFKD